MKKKMAMVLAAVLLLVGCRGGGTADTIGATSSIADQPKATELEEEYAFPGTYTVPDGWVKSDKYSTSEMLFYVEEGHEDDKTPDNISINVGTNRYSLEEHMAFRDAIVRQLLMQLDGVDAQLNGDGTYTAQDYVLYTFTIDEGDIVTKQYYIVKDYGFCLVHVTNFTGSESVYEAAQTMVDSFIWEDEN